MDKWLHKKSVFYSNSLYSVYEKINHISPFVSSINKEGILIFDGK